MTWQHILHWGLLLKPLLVIVTHNLPCCLGEFILVSQFALDRRNTTDALGVKNNFYISILRRSRRGLLTEIMLPVQRGSVPSQGNQSHTTWFFLLIVVEKSASVTIRNRSSRAKLDRKYINYIESRVIISLPTNFSMVSIFYEFQSWVIFLCGEFDCC